MTAHVTAGEAHALGIDTPPARTRTTRRAAPSRGLYRTTCTRCGATFDTQAAEDRHLTATHHPRFELTLTTQEESPDELHQPAPRCDD